MSPNRHSHGSLLALALLLGGSASGASGPGSPATVPASGSSLAAWLRRQSSAGAPEQLLPRPFDTARIAWRVLARTDGVTVGHGFQFLVQATREGSFEGEAWWFPTDDLRVDGRLVIPRFTFQFGREHTGLLESLTRFLADPVGPRQGSEVLDATEYRVWIERAGAVPLAVHLIEGRDENYEPFARIFMALEKVAKASLRDKPVVLFSERELAAFGSDLLYRLVGCDWPEAVEQVLKRGVRPRLTEDGLLTPLHCAAGDGYLDTAKVLVAHGADVNQCVRRGTSPLWYAAVSGHLDLVRWLLAHGADPTLASRDFDSDPTKPYGTAREGALAYNHGEVAQLLGEAERSWRQAHPSGTMKVTDH